MIARNTSARRVLTPAVVVTLGIVLSGCGADPQTGSTGADGSAAPTSEQLLERLDADSEDPVEVIEQLDTMPVEDRPEGVFASVETDELILSDDTGDQAELSLPDDEVYLSAAPYVEQTHECHFHSLTTCVGEQRNSEISVKITDLDEDEVIVDEVTRTYDNGFIGYWVPAEAELEISIDHEEGSLTETVTTREGDPTCLTELRLT
ncbi:CueP family metal-binding protein [Nesterenkonia marinintestina]|uniref:CueP family metal-binding protein n=1 Tax=Nesterenkonia marinintestina TaxID=2979865 RepID=UPI0021BFF0E1|nr:CueP family metal-binding protein [Nesterenkonia sp. GX14115]